jgi:type I restriction enzyme S subunit
MSEPTADYRELGSLVRPIDAKLTLRKDPGKPYVGLEHLPSRGAYLLGWEAASHSVSTNSIFSTGDVLFGKLRPNLRKCVSAPFDGYCSTDILVLRAREDIHAGFAARVFQSERVGAAAERTAIGTKMPRTSWTHLSGLEVFCPGFPDQGRIDHILGTLDIAIQQTEAMIAKLKALKQGLLHDLLTRGVDANGELRPPQSQAPHFYKSSPLGFIPRDWMLKTGSDVCEEIVVGIVIRPTQYYRTEGIPVLRSANVRENRLSMVELVFMSERDHRSLRKSAVRPGDVLTVRTGYPGTSCVVDSSVREANCVDILISRPSDRLDANFWSLWINSHLGKSQVLAAQGGLAQQHFNVGDLQKLIISMPGRPEQTEIARRLTAAKVRTDAESRALATLTDLKRGLIDDLLTGRVRVTSLQEKATHPVLKAVA